MTDRAHPHDPDHPTTDPVSSGQSPDPASGERATTAALTDPVPAASQTVLTEPVPAAGATAPVVSGAPRRRPSSRTLTIVGASLAALLLLGGVFGGGIALGSTFGGRGPASVFQSGDQGGPRSDRPGMPGMPDGAGPGRRGEAPEIETP
jgi:hypothetical protein